MNSIFVIVIFIFVVVVGILGFIYFKLKAQTEKNKDLQEFKIKIEATQQMLQEALERVTQRVTERLDKVTDQVGLRLGENVKAINESKSFLTQRVDNTEKTVREVTNKLSTLYEASERLLTTNQEILQFQKMLRVPKVRGGFGEILLESLLRDSIPSERYEMQYKFASSGEIADAVIRLMDGMIVAIDSKFPLANFEKIVAAEGEEKKAHYRAFINDIKKHVRDIATKYISSKEHTLDYAFMYIPMEGIYYEMVVRRGEVGEEVWDFCLKQKVIPVSPNSFLSYLHTLLIGFRGMKIEKQTKEILHFIGQLRQDFFKFEEDFGMIGNHLRHAQSKFEDSNKRLDRFHSRLDQVDIHKELNSLPLDSTSESVSKEQVE